MTVFTLIILFVISFVWAVRSMGDVRVPKEISELIARRKVRGKIVFFKGKVKHYSSSSSSSSRSSF